MLALLAACNSPTGGLAGTCTAPSTICGGSCVDTATDAANCGRCLNQCNASLICQAGACRCATGTMTCNGSCINVATDANNCGGCDLKCGAGQTCAAGQCSGANAVSGPSGPSASSGPTCTLPLKLCSGSCATVQEDEANCGNCGVICAGSLQCLSGTCACVPGTVQCGNQCSTLQDDNNNCGACNNVCAVGTSCSGGSCLVPAPSLTATNLEKQPFSHTAEAPADRLSLTISGGGPPATYQCRSGLKSALTGESGWAACATGHVPSLTGSSSTDGTWRSEVRVFGAGGVKSAPVGVDYYVHSSLDSVARCPEANDANVTGGFSAARTSICGSPSCALPAFAGNLDVTPPLVTIPFAGVTNSPWNTYSEVRIPALTTVPINVTAARNLTYPGGGAFATLRHRFVVNADNTLVLVQRVRPSPTATVTPCGMDMPLGIGTYMPGDVSGSYQPRPAIRDCKSYVLAANGTGVCLGAGPSPAVIKRSNFGWMKLMKTRGAGEFGRKCFTPGVECPNPGSHIVYLPE